MLYKRGAEIVVLGEIVMSDEETMKWVDYVNAETADVKYEFWDETPKNNTIVFNAGDNDEMIKISLDGFYVRGIAVEQGPGEAEAVYNAFKQWLAWTALATK